VAQATSPVFLGQRVQARRELSLRLVEVSEAREHERLLIAQSVLATERAQLAREMHDAVSHQVSLIAVRAGALQVGSRDTEAKEAAATIRRLSVQTLDELRHMVGILRASGSRPTELTPQPSLADLDRLVAGSGIDTDLRTDLPGDLPPPVQRAVYRTVQEALTNIRKHAPGATATIRMRQEDRTLRVTVTNTAPSRPALSLPGAHHGLIGLRQRAELLGGTVTSRHLGDGGYELRLVLPVDSTP
jgi:signal transduction histidine kinase